MIADVLTFKGFRGWTCGDTADTLTWNEAEAGRPRPSETELLAWEAEYNKRRNVPRAVTMRQARLALLRAGLLSAVNAAVAAAPSAEGEAARIEWEYGSVVERDSPLIASFSEALSLTDQQVDDLFTMAATL